MFKEDYKGQVGAQTQNNWDTGLSGKFDLTNIEKSLSLEKSCYQNHKQGPEPTCGDEVVSVLKKIEWWERGQS